MGCWDVPPRAAATYRLARCALGSDFCCLHKVHHGAVVTCHCQLADSRQESCRRQEAGRHTHAGTTRAHDTAHRTAHYPHETPTLLNPNCNSNSQAPAGR
eukprot:scaffold2800_cov135-Isochrysis_galbana.AAC.7